MDKNIKGHIIFIEQKIDELEKELAKSSEKTSVNQKIRDLNDYHKSAVGNFQHERHIHLLVTLFFAILLLLSAGASIILSILNVTSRTYDILSILILTIFTIIFTTEIFYVVHYFKLENGTQKLYKISDKLYRLIAK